MVGRRQSSCRSARVEFWSVEMARWEKGQNVGLGIRVSEVESWFCEDLVQVT